MELGLKQESDLSDFVEATGGSWEDENRSPVSLVQ